MSTSTRQKKSNDQQESLELAIATTLEFLENATEDTCNTRVLASDHQLKHIERQHKFRTSIVPWELGNVLTQRLLIPSQSFTDPSLLDVAYSLAVGAYLI